MKKFISLFILLLSVSTGFAQKKQPAIKAYSSDEFKLAKKDAEAYYKELNYSAALKIYERLLVNEPNSAEFNYKL